MRRLSFLLIGLIISYLFILPVAANAASDNYYEKLTSDWQFYEQQLFNGSDSERSTKKSLTVNLPVEFEELTGTISTYGTFVKDIEIPKAYVGKMIALEIPYVYGAVKIFANDEKLIELGKVGTTDDEHETDLQSVVIPLKLDQANVRLALQVSSFEHIRGGFSKEPIIGDWNYLHDSFQWERLIIAFFTGIVFIAGVLTTLIGLLSRDEKILLTFGVFSIGVAVRSIFSAPFIYHELPVDISYIWATKMEYITTNLVFLLYVVFIYLLFKKIVYKPIIYGSVTILASLAVLALFTQPIIFQTAFFKVSILMVGFVIYSIVIMIRALKSKMEMAKPLLAGVIFVFIGLIVDLISGMGIVNLPPLSLFTISMNVILIVIFLGQSYVKHLVKVTKLNKELTNMNYTLDEKVKERTAQLSYANAELSDLAMKDGLTGIYNRHKFNELLKYHFNLSVKNNEKLSLIMIDVDEFKKYNDYYGHVRGDQLLKELVTMIKNNLSEEIIFARYGGEEFVLILPNYSHQQAFQIGESLRMLIEDANIEHLGREEGQVTISLGGVERTAKTHIQSEIDLVEIADARLYLSKKLGRNKTTFCDEKNEMVVY